MKAAKTQKNLKNMPHPPQKKLWKIKGNSITPAQKNAPISQTSLEGLKLRTKARKMKLGQLQEDISKASLPVSADLCNNFKNQFFWKLTKEKFTLREVNFGGAANISSLLSIMLHITLWTLMLMLHIRQPIYLVLKNVLSASVLIVHITTFDEISLQFQSTNISMLHMYRTNLSLP